MSMDPNLYPPDPYEEYLALMDIGYGPEGRWDPYGKYGYSNQIPEQLYDMYKPRSDAAANTMVNRSMGGSEGWENFSNDVYLQADPLVQPYLAEILANNDGDMISAVNDWNSGEHQDELRDRVGRTAWDQIGQTADWGTRNKINTAGDGEAKDDIAIDYLNSGIENLLAQGSPSMGRNSAMQEMLLQRYGARPITGGELPSAGGPGFASGSAASQGPEDVFLGGGDQGGDEKAQLEQMYAGMAEADPEGWQAVLRYGGLREQMRTQAESEWDNPTARGRREAERNQRMASENPNSFQRATQRIQARRRGREDDGDDRTWVNKAGDWLDQRLPTRQARGRFDWSPWN